MPRAKLTIEYDGSAYCGWQQQANGRTIQGEIQNALAVIYKSNIKITGSGRTDAGVHARNQIAHCDLPDTDVYKLRRSLNGLLKNDIVIKNIETVHDGFHARFDATEREYRYYLSRKPTALMRTTSWLCLYPLNITLLQLSAARFFKYKNYKSFCKAHGGNKTYFCNIKKSYWTAEGDMLVYTVAANRFLYGMVRALVGAMLWVGQGKIKLSDLDKIIKAQDRTLVPFSVPGKGLVLEKITY